MKHLILKRPKPRNPLVAPCLQRAAGAHRRGEKSRRQSAGHALRAELKQLHPPPTQVA